MVKNAAYIAALEKLVKDASPWVATRMNKHFRDAKKDKVPHHRDMHQAKSDQCEEWLQTAAALGLDPTSAAPESAAA